MAITSFTAPASTSTDTIVARLTADGNLIGVQDADFSLHRADTNAVIPATIEENKQGNYFWDITTQLTGAYRGRAYLEIRTNAFRDLQSLAFLPTSPLRSNVFEFIVPPPAAPTNFRASNGVDSTTLRWDVLTGFTYEYRQDGGSWIEAVSPIVVTGLALETDYTFDLRVKESDAAPAGAIATVSIRTFAFPIEAIDEQFIPVGMEDYELVIGLLGQNLNVSVDGLQEGFYQTFRTLDNGNSQILVKNDSVERLIEKAEWRVNYHDLGNDYRAHSDIIYNVVPVAPILIDPGQQTIYKGVPFEVLVEVRNNASVQRGESELVGLKTESVSEDDKDYIQSLGMLPADTNLTFSQFQADYYVENSGGDDDLQVPFTIRDDAVAPVISRLSATYSLLPGRPVRIDFSIRATPAPIVTLSDDTPEWLSVRHVSGTTYRIEGDLPGTERYTGTVIARGLTTVQQNFAITVQQPPTAGTLAVVSSFGASHAGFGWTALPSDGGSPITGLEAEYNGSGDWATPVGFNLSNMNRLNQILFQRYTNNYPVDPQSIAPGSYTVRVRLINAAGTGEPSNRLSFTVR